MLQSSSMCLSRKQAADEARQPLEDANFGCAGVRNRIGGAVARNRCSAEIGAIPVPICVDPMAH